MIDPETGEPIPDESGASLWVLLGLAAAIIFGIGYLAIAVPSALHL